LVKSLVLHKNAAWLSLSNAQNGSKDVQILGFFGDEFQAESSVSG